MKTKTSTKVLAALFLSLSLFGVGLAVSHSASEWMNDHMGTWSNVPDEMGAARNPFLQTERGKIALKAMRLYCEGWNIDPRNLPENSPFNIAIKRALVAERL